MNLICNHIFVQGDWHGHRGWGSNIPDNSILICVGDIALGFPNLTLEKLVNFFTPILKHKKSKLLLVRGNHDSPAIWREKLNSDDIILVQDFSEITINGKNFYFVGGGISLDRTSRLIGHDYWTDEEIQYSNYIKPTNKVDVLITHSAPAICYPRGFNSFCHAWFRHDSRLESELTKEREFLNKVLEDVKPKLHFYGHYHRSVTEQIGDCKHVLLDELELQEIV